MIIPYIEKCAVFEQENNSSNDNLLKETNTVTKLTKIIKRSNVGSKLAVNLEILSKLHFFRVGTYEMLRTKNA